MRRKTRTVLRDGVWLIEKMTKRGPVVIGSNPFIEKNANPTTQSQPQFVPNLESTIKQPTQKTKKGNLGRPRVRKPNDQKLVTFRIDAKLYKTIKKFRNDKTLSEWIRELIEKELHLVK